MATFNYYLREKLKQHKTNDPRSIHLVVNWTPERGKRSRLVTSTTIKTSILDWDVNKQAIKDRKVVAYRELNNQFLGKFKSEAVRLYNGFIRENDRFPFKDELKSLYGRELTLLGKTESAGKKHTLLSFIDEFIVKSKTRANLNTGKTISPSTIQSYKRTLKYLKEYHEIKPISFDSIDLKFYNEFYAFLMEKQFSTNTIGKLFKEIKVFMNEALEEGLTENKAWKSKKFRRYRSSTDS